MWYRLQQSLMRIVNRSIARCELTRPMSKTSIVKCSTKTYPNIEITPRQRYNNYFTWNAWIARIKRDKCYIYIDKTFSCNLISLGYSEYRRCGQNAGIFFISITYLSSVVDVFFFSTDGHYSNGNKLCSAARCPIRIKLTF